MELDAEQAFRLFLISGMPQAYVYSRMERRREQERKETKETPQR